MNPASVMKAVGLRYDPSHGLPKVIFKGTGPLAEEIVTRSIQGRGAPVVRDPGLVDRLYRLPIDAPIGSDVYRLVAIILAHILAIDAKATTEEKHG